MGLFPLLAAAAALLCASGVPARAEGSRLDPRLQLMRLDRQRGTVRQTHGVAAAGNPSDPLVNVFLRLKGTVTRARLAARYPDAVFGSQTGGILTAKFRVSALDALAGDSDVEYAEASSQYRPVLNVVKSSTTNGSDFLGVLDPAYVNFGSNLGTGVILGFVDSGIDFDHLDFRDDADPTKSRILYIWDQTDSGGPAPGGSYISGTQWTKAQIENEIDGSPPGIVRQTDTEGHGTHVAGIAAGDGSGSDGSPPAGTYVGMAPKADIIMVKTTFNGSDIVDGINYIVDKAAAEGKRAVINLSLSGQDGPHDGTLSFEQSINTVAASTPVVIAAGNDQALDAHASFSFTPFGSRTFNFNRFSAATLLTIDFWAATGDAYTVTVTDDLSNNVTVTNGNSSTGNAWGGATVDVFNGTNSHPDGDKQIFIRFSGTISQSNFTFAFTRTANGGTGRLDGWVFDTSLAKFTSDVDTTGTLGSPGVVANAVTVGSYCGRRQWRDKNGTLQTDSNCAQGDISTFSGRGPTRDGRQKPDLAAPGERVLSALGTDMSPAESASLIADDDRHRAIQGTSMAAPVVSGAIALKIQQNPNITAAQIKSDLVSSTRGDTKATGLPNNTWGAGKLKVIACGELVTATPTVAAATTLGTSSITWTWSSVPNAASYNLYYATAASTLIANTASPSHTLTSLAANTTYAIKVFGLNACGEGPGEVSQSTSTLSEPMAGASFSKEISSITVTYTPLAGQNEGYLVRASTASDFSGTVFSSATDNSSLGSLRLDGLTGLTTYYLRAATLNKSGAAHFITVGATVTNTSLVAPGAVSFSGIDSGGITAGWTVGANPAGLEYIVHASTAGDFSGTPASSQTFNLSAAFSSLSVNTTYYFRVRATTGPFGATASTATWAVPPVAASESFAGVWPSSLTAQWALTGNPSGTPVRVQASTRSDFGTLLQDGVQAGLTTTYLSLDPNTTVYVRIGALNRNNILTSFLTISTSTLSNPPGADPPAFVSVTSSITVRWSALPASPSSATCEGYRIDASTSPDFYPIASWKKTSDPSASSLGLQGLLFQTTYYLRVGALNWNMVPNYLSLGSSVTVVAILSSSTINPGQNLVLNISPSVLQMDAVRVELPDGTFPPGTNVTVNASVPFVFASASANQANLVPLGEGVAFDIEAGGAQPSRPVAILITYNDAFLPTGTDETRLVIANERDGTWTILPTTIDTGANTLRAETTHFSLFAPFFAPAGSDLGAINVFPVPWMPGSGDPLFDAQRLIFSNFPQDGKVRLYTLLGELVWEADVNASGMLFWDGKNRRGVNAASGSYLAVYTGGGSRKVARVVVIR